MLGISFSECGALLHQIVLISSVLYQSFKMFLSRSESLKWIRKKFSKRNSSHSSTSANNSEEHIPPPKISKKHNNNNSNSGTNTLGEVLVLHETPLEISSPPLAPDESNPSKCREEDSAGDEEGTMSMQCNRSAPIARAEDEEIGGNGGDDGDEVWNAAQGTSCGPVLGKDIEANLSRSKSRVRDYLRKCKSCWLAVSSLPHHQHQHQQHLEQQHQTSTSDDPKPTLEVNVFDEPKPLVAVLVEDNTSSAWGILEEVEDGNDSSYEDVDFRLNSTVVMAVASRSINNNDPPNASGLVPEIDRRQAEMQLSRLETKEEQLTLSIQMESDVAALIDSHLSGIYPVYWQRTRAVLVREARDVVVSCYRGCLATFEREFLCKFTEIASVLKERHVLGETLIWCQGWPLATPDGEVVLHLGGFEEEQIQPNDIYLCVRTVENCAEPQLQAVWRSPAERPTLYSAATSVRSCSIDYHDPTVYLSVTTVEMLSDDLPQLLQNLLVGVENSIERLSLNELQRIPFAGDRSSGGGGGAGGDGCGTDESLINNNNINKKHPQPLRSSLVGTGSPKCVLKRSELITKNKLLNNKYLLRRLTNRQDSMNSTSSGNSSASALSSTSSDSNSSTTTTTPTTNNNNKSSCSGSGGLDGFKGTRANVAFAPNSPALPRFCLGNSFPHIDSDEENAEEKSNSSNDDPLESELRPPTLITEIPEKLLTSGIYLPGTRDLKGNPLVTVAAEDVITAGLNCYEVATLLLFYSTIPEELVANRTVLEKPPKQLADTNSTSTLGTTSASGNGSSSDNVQKTFTILIVIEKAQQLCVVDLINQSLRLLRRRVALCEIVVVCLDPSLVQLFENGGGVGGLESKATAVAADPVTNGGSGDCDKKQAQRHLVKFISVDKVTTSVAAAQTPHGCGLRGLHHHDVRKWREFFVQYESFQSQCAGTAQRLIAALSDIRAADLQGLPTRRQLYAQHRALSRALMDSELHHLRKRGSVTLSRLQELARAINSSQRTSGGGGGGGGGDVSAVVNYYSRRGGGVSKTSPLTTVVGSHGGSGCASYAFSTYNNTNNNNSHISHNILTKPSAGAVAAALTAAAATATAASTAANATAKSSDGPSATHNTSATIASRLNNNSINNNNNNNNNGVCSTANLDVAIRLQKVTLLFNEIERAAKRLEQLTEQRRERLRELTRQRALEDEINEVTTWITSDGSEALQRFLSLQLDSETEMKEHEREFEKYYFISMKHLAKGRDLHVAAAGVEALREGAASLKTALDSFAEKLEHARERIEGAARLHHLLNLHIRDESVEQEVERLAERYGVPGLLDKYRHFHRAEESVDCVTGEGLPRVKPNSLDLTSAHCPSNKVEPSLPLTTSTPNPPKMHASNHRFTYGSASYRSDTCHCWRDSRNLDDMDELLDAEEEEGQSKIADSGLGGCNRCEGSPKLTRVCSCQSLNEAANLYEKSDGLDDECFERPSQRYLDIHSPLEANAHLQCFASTFELPKLEELSCLDPKIQKTLLLIMREMIGTERDYVRSLYYVIEHYVDELLRDDIPQPLRGQRNVIFGNIEKIFEFHNNHFLIELERYERNPLKVGAAFLQMESKFYLYALYNKNKPKSDTLMSEYGTAFFKSKQCELNDKMDLASYLLKPVQRMGKYALLLQQLVKACSSVQGNALQEIAADVEELQKAEEMVKFQLRHGNDLLAMDSLRDCDVNVKEQGRLLRQNEFLVWQGRGGKKTLRQVFLFEELILFSKARRFPDHKNLDLYIYKNSMKTSDIGLTAHVGDSSTKFEIWFRKRKPEDTWTLQCMSEDIKNVWTEEISRLLWQQAKRNREIRLAEMSSMGIGSKPCLDIRPSNNQISDRSITISQLGKASKFRHSFVGLHVDQMKATRRPNSLISESSISSGTSSSSLSTGSLSSHERLGKPSLSSSSSSSAHNHQGLELINETQTLMACGEGASKVGGNTNSTAMNILSATSATHCRSHKQRSTTLVSQLSMESGIVSDMCVSPDQEHSDLAGWTQATTSEVLAPMCPKLTTRCHTTLRKADHTQESRAEGRTDDEEICLQT